MSPIKTHGGIDLEKNSTDKKKKLLSKLMDIPYLVIAGVIYAVAYKMFLIPGTIFVGGIGGIATVWEKLYGLNTGLVIFLLNLPLIAALMIMYGWRTGIRSLIGIGVASAFLSVAEALNILPDAFANPEENKLLYAIFGGIVLGIAIGFFFSRGYTTGGTDIIALLLKPKFKKLSTSKLILITDVVVIVYAAVSMKDWLTVLYSFVAIFMMTSTLGIVTSGFDKGCIAYIFSSDPETIAQSISDKIHRGVTLLDGMGWYTKNPEQIIMCVVKKSEIYQIKLIAKTVDPKSFIIIGETTETIGLGFKENIGEGAFEQKKK